MSPEEVPAYLEALILRVDDPAGRAAADGMVRAFDEGIKTVELRRYTHGAGSRTPSPRGGTPALVSGKLRDSFKIKEAKPAGSYRWKSSDGPTIIYARIQEYGGTIYPKVKKWLHWVDAEGSHFAKKVTLPARPYMKPAHNRMVADGSLTRAARNAFMEALGI